MTSDMTIAMQLVLSVIFGGAVGYIREREGKAAGLRTHMLVCLGSTLLMVISAIFLNRS